MPNLAAPRLYRAGGQIAQGRNFEKLRHLRQMRQVHHLRDHSGADQPDFDWSISHSLTPMLGRNRALTEDGLRFPAGMRLKTIQQVSECSDKGVNA